MYLILNYACQEVYTIFGTEESCGERHGYETYQIFTDFGHPAQLPVINQATA